MTAWTEYTTAFNSGDPGRGGTKKALAELDKSVNDAIRRGWQPLGGVAIAVDRDLVIVSQAMVK